MKNLLFLFQILIGSLILTSCNSVLLKQYKQKDLIINTEGDTYKSVEIINAPVNNFEIKASIEFRKSYRIDSSAWAGFFIKTKTPQGKHREDSGYLCFVREDGEIGVHSSPPPNREIIKQTYDFEMKSNNHRDLTIRCYNSQIIFIVDGELAYTIDNIELNGQYISANCGSGISAFKIKSIKKIKS